MAKAEQRNKRQEQAARLAYLRNATFRTAGFGSNEPIPSLAKAAAMHAFNKRLIGSQRPQPSVSK